MVCISEKITTTTAAAATTTTPPKMVTSPHQYYSLSPSSPTGPLSPAAGSPKANTSSTPPSPSPSPSPPPIVIISPCAACKILRRRCVDKCVLAPYFPPTDPLKFTIAHKVFGASNIIKMLQELPEHQRADAVNSMVYEANSRIRDPVYGCAGAICQLQNQISELQAELAKAQAEMLNLQCQNDNLRSLIICRPGTEAREDDHHQEPMSDHDLMIISSCHQINNNINDHDNNNINTSFFLEDANLYAGWDPLWT